MQSIHSRRRFLAVLSGAAIAVSAAPGMGLTGIESVSAARFVSATPQAVDPADQVLLRVGYEGGFVPAEYLLTNLPFFTLYADGRVITTGPMIEIFPQPALPNLRQTKLTATGIESVLDAARTAGLADGDRHYDSNMIADASTTVFTFNDGSTSTVVEAYALSLDEELIANAEDAAARAKLIELQLFLGDLAAQLPLEGIEAGDAPYMIERINIYAREFDPATIDPEMAQEPMTWPLATPLREIGEPIASGPLSGSTRCAALSGDDASRVVALLATANQLTPWVSDGKQYQLWVRPLLPDESGCSHG